MSRKHSPDSIRGQAKAPPVGPVARGYALDETLGRVGSRINTALSARNGPVYPTSVSYARSLLETVAEEEKEGVPESHRIDFSEDFRRQYDHLTKQMSIELVATFNAWAARIRNQRMRASVLLGGAVDAYEETDADFSKASHSMGQAVNDICERWLTQGAWIGPLYRALYNLGSRDEILQIHRATTSGASAFFRFGEVVRSIVQKYEPQLTELYRKERGDFIIPDQRPEQMVALIENVRKEFSTIEEELRAAFVKWIQSNRPDSRPQPYEESLNYSFAEYLEALRVLWKTFTKTLFIEEAPNVGELCIDMIRVTEAFEKKRTPFRLLKRERGPAPKQPDFKLTERVQGRAAELFAYMGELMVSYPDLLEDLPRVPRPEVGAESEEQKRKAHATAEIRSMTDEIWRLAGIQFNEWMDGVGLAPTGTPRQAGMKTFEEIKSIMYDALFIWERRASFSASVFWQMMDEILYENAKIVMSSNVCMLPKIFSPIFAELAPRFQKAMQDYYEADETLNPQLTELKSRANEIIDRHIQSFQGAAREWITSCRPRVHPQRMDVVESALISHCDHIIALKERALHALVVGEVPHFRSLFRMIEVYAEDAVRLNCYSLRPEDFIAKKKRGESFEIQTLSAKLLQDLGRELESLLGEYPALMNPVPKSQIPEASEEILPEPVVETTDELQASEDPSAYAEILCKARELRATNKEKLALIAERTGRLTGVVRIGQECLNNLNRLLETPLEHTLHQAQMILDQMECFLHHHEVSPDGRTLRSHRNESDFATAFLQISLTTGVEPGVSNPALKEGQAAVDQTLLVRRELAARLEALALPLRTTEERIEGYQASIDRARLALGRLREELESGVPHVDRDTLLGDIQRLEANSARVSEALVTATTERDSIRSQREVLEEKIARVDAHREMFNEQVLAAMRNLLEFTQTLHHD